MKNCDPLVSGPLLAMLTMPRVLCWRRKVMHYNTQSGFNTGGGGHPGICQTFVIASKCGLRSHQKQF